MNWEPEEQFQWEQWHERYIGRIPKYKKEQKMDLKRAINRLETVARRASWQDTEQARAIATVIEAAKKQLPPEPRDHLHLYKRDGVWVVNAGGFPWQQLQTKETAEEWHQRSSQRSSGGSLVVKVPV